MVKISKSLFFSNLILTCLIISCSSIKTSEEQETLRDYVIKREYKKGLDELEKLKSYKNENSKLLYYLEKGINLHLQGKYNESLSEFETAKQIHNALYTESLTKKVQTLIANDNYDNYYGETYERSLIHYYLSLNHLLLFQENPKETLKKPFAARAEILAWDSYLNEQIEEKKGQAVFKNDLVAKVYGALIHEMIATKEDKQIALNLYKDAKILVFRNYNSYPSFNHKYQEFNKNFSKLPELTEEEVKKQFVEETHFQHDLLEFLDSKIFLLTKELRPNELTKIQNKFKLKSEKENSNITIILERGIIPKKEAKLVYFPLGSYLYANPNSSISNQVNNYGFENVFSYAQNNLGFRRPPPDYSYGPEVGSYSKNQYAGDLAISFEVPILRNVFHDDNLKLVIYD